MAPGTTPAPARSRPGALRQPDRALPCWSSGAAWPRGEV